MLCRNEQHAFELEVKLIAALRKGKVDLVNMTDGGEGLSGFIMSDEQKEKLSLALKGKIVSEETRAKMSASAVGKIISDETKAKMSATPKSDEHKAKLSEAAKNRPPVTNETKYKMSNSSKLAWQKRKS